MGLDTPPPPKKQKCLIGINYLTACKWNQMQKDWPRGYKLFHTQLSMEFIHDTEAQNTRLSHLI